LSIFNKDILCHNLIQEKGDYMLSKTSEYALRTMVWLAKQKPLIFLKTEELAEAIKAPEAYLSKILQSLSKVGLVQARKGIKGGYTLNKPPESISLFDVIMAVDPSHRILKCPLGIPNHETLCPLHQKLDNVHAEMEKTFGNCYLSDLVNDTKRSPLCEIE
jgi:Rrf2 family protein